MYGYEESPRVNLTLDIPAQRLMSAYIERNEEMEKQVKLGIENAIKRLTEGNNLAKLVEEEVYESLKKSFNNWSVQDHIRRVFDERLSEYLRNKAKEFSDKVLDKIDI